MAANLKSSMVHRPLNKPPEIVAQAVVFVRKDIRHSQVGTCHFGSGTTEVVVVRCQLEWNLTLLAASVYARLDLYWGRSSLDLELNG